MNTRHKIRPVVSRKVRRDLRTHLNEGIMDFLSGIWDLAGEMFGGAISSAFEKSFEAVTDIANENIPDEYKQGDDAIESLSELEPAENEKDRPVYLKALAPAFIKASNEVIKNLESTESVKNWTPKSESKEDIESWKKENGEASSGLSKSVGVIKSLSKYLENSGIDFDEVEIENDKINPGEQVKFILESCKSMKEFWNSVSYEELKDDTKKIVSSLSSVESSADKVAKVIAESAKEQQKEWVTLKSFIGAQIISEQFTSNRKRSIMRITETQLRRTIHKTIKELYSGYYTDFTQQEPATSADDSLRIQVADEEVESGICPACHGKGFVMGKDCKMCDGTGEFAED